MSQTLGGIAPVSPPEERPQMAAEKPRRKPPERGKAGGRTRGKMVWLTDAENSQLEAKAAKSGLSVASYLRASALGDAGPRARRAPTIDQQVLSAGIAALNMIGSNINQIARASNIGKEYSPELLDWSLTELRALLATMREAFAP